MGTKGLSAEQIKASMEFTKKIFQPQWMALMSLFFNLIFAAIFGLITGLVWKKNNRFTNVSFLSFLKEIL